MLLVNDCLIFNVKQKLMHLVVADYRLINDFVIRVSDYQLKMYMRRCVCVALKDIIHQLHCCRIVRMTFFYVPFEKDQLKFGHQDHMTKHIHVYLTKS